MKAYPIHREYSDLQEWEKVVAPIVLKDLDEKTKFDPFKSFTYILKDIRTGAGIDDLFSCVNLFLPFRDALNLSEWSDLSPKQFIEPPTKTRLDSINRFGVFGLDFKITPTGEIKLIEVNGANSGMKGFAKAHLTAESGDGITRSDRALERSIDAYGRKERAMIGTFSVLNGEASHRFPALRELINESIGLTLGESTVRYWPEIHEEWDNKCQKHGEWIARIERVLGDKLSTDSLLEDL